MSIIRQQNCRAAIGADSLAGGANSFAGGAGAAAFGLGAVTTATNQVMLGGSGVSVVIADIAASTAAQQGRSTW